jgi:hypothetical protein
MSSPIPTPRVPLPPAINKMSAAGGRTRISRSREYQTTRSPNVSCARICARARRKRLLDGINPTLPALDPANPSDVSRAGSDGAVVSESGAPREWANAPAEACPFARRGARGRLPATQKRQARRRAGQNSSSSPCSTSETRRHSSKRVVGRASPTFPGPPVSRSTVRGCSELIGVSSLP